MAVQLDKKVIGGAVVNYFFDPGFPDTIYISLENSFACGIGTVVNILNDMESTLEFTPLANIKELVLNIPSKDEFQSFFQANYGIMSPKDITKEKALKFWNEYPFEFASYIGGIKIDWE